jgi:hypothetical protein
MDVVIGIVGLAAIFGAIYLFQKGTSALGKKANQHVFARGAHSEGQELVSQRLVFAARANVETVKTAVLSKVKVAPKTPVAIADAYLVGATDSLIIYECGNKLHTQFRGRLRLESTNDGVRGSWEISDWTEADGIVAGQSVMKRLIADINTALRSVDPNAALRTR